MLPPWCCNYMLPECIHFRVLVVSVCLVVITFAILALGISLVLFKNCGKNGHTELNCDVSYFKYLLLSILTFDTSDSGNRRRSFGTSPPYYSEPLVQHRHARVYRGWELANGFLRRKSESCAAFAKLWKIRNVTLRFRSLFDLPRDIWRLMSYFCDSFHVPYMTHTWYIY